MHNYDLVAYGNIDDNVYPILWMREIVHAIMCMYLFVGQIFAVYQSTTNIGPLENSLLWYHIVGNFRGVQFSWLEKYIKSALARVCNTHCSRA